MDNVYENLLNVIAKDRVLLNEPMSNHTTFRIGGKADIFIKIQTLEELKNVLEICKNMKVTIIGNGSNTLVKDNGIRGVVLKLDFNSIKFNGTYIEVRGRSATRRTFKFCLSKFFNRSRICCRYTRNGWWCIENECRGTWKIVWR